MMTWKNPVNIASSRFDNVFLRMDGRNVPKHKMDDGGGTVNCQFGAFSWEKFNVEDQDGAVVIGSVAYPGTYLRMDGRGVTKTTDEGGGTDNCQFGAFSWEKFKVHEKDGTYQFESVAFPGVYLRMDGREVTKTTDEGGGTANCQFGAFSWETFRLPHAG